MADSLNVIALISGGKDSFYSLLHCLQNGHNVVALGNLYPPLPPACPLASHRAEDVDDRVEEEEEHDLNSFMYQTVGHTVIPLYEQALGIPLYRQEIRGSAVQTALSYRFQGPAQDAGEEVGQNEEDETESLIPLLKGIIAAHPEANALSTGAILSTYQRTRIESIALRLGLTPLAYLWQYPLLPPGTQSSLLGDMKSVGLDARIVKVASAGLDEMFLWENVADPRVVSRIERSMGRFGMSGDGAVLGEGGEFETLTIDGPRSLFRGKIVVEESMKKVIREGGGSAWLRILGASVVMKEGEEALEGKCRTPDLLEKKFKECLDFIAGSDMDTALPGLEHLTLESTSKPEVFSMPSGRELQNDILHWTVQKEARPNDTISTQAADLVNQIRTLLHGSSLQSTSIVSTVIMLRSMADFGTINQVNTLLINFSLNSLRCSNTQPKDI
jgi:diphthine-ammonia ligase